MSRHLLDIHLEKGKIIPKLVFIPRCRVKTQSDTHGTRQEVAFFNILFFLFFFLSVYISSAHTVYFPLCIYVFYIYFPLISIGSYYCTFIYLFKEMYIYLCVEDIMGDGNLWQALSYSFYEKENRGGIDRLETEI